MTTQESPSSTLSDHPVLVTGATGDIGMELVKLLVASGVPVRAMYRKKEQQGELSALGATPVHGDFDDADSLRAAMTGCDQLFLLTAPLPQQLDQDKRAIDAARTVGVRHVVRVSAADSNTVTGVPWARAHAHADHYLAAQAGDERATYLLTGPEPLSMPDLAARLSTHLGRRVRYLQLPGLGYATVLRLAGQSWWTARGLRVQFAQVVRLGHDLDTTWEVERLLGRPARTIDDYLRDNIDVFRRAA